MRKALEAISLAGLVFLLAVTAYAVEGSSRLPARIPTHFGMDGQPNGWGLPSALFVLPGVGVFVYLLMTLVSWFPSAFNYPVRVTVANRDRLQALALGMIAWLKAEVLGLMCWIQMATIDAARQGHAGSALNWLVPVTIALLFLTIGWHIAAMFRVNRPYRG